MRMSVIIPTYKRTADLYRCLEGLRRQRRRPDEVVVVVREGDEETAQLLTGPAAARLPLRTAMVALPGQVAALNRGLEAALGDIVSIVDDDTVPAPDWLARIERHFEADAAVGGVGGRDDVHTARGRVSERRRRVGIVQWHGRVIGNHHLGDGPPREVDVLKGANMSYRRTAVGEHRFDTRLAGTGAQVHNDLDFSYGVKRAGWKLVYDPEVRLDHYPAQRHDSDQRGAFNRAAQFNMAYNEAYIMIKHLGGPRRLAYWWWAQLCGTAAKPGAVWALLLLLRGAPEARLRWQETQRGRAAGKRAAAEAGRDALPPRSPGRRAYGR
ncbi:glycosyltransferase family 2 protein [Paenibacillus sp. IB182496]|uniref:Glycosyltransferase family 2 protein n=1 Tax=Paenibacillus sabuli TaxID=2772509 RepID=A0A927BWP5_9BACL|nr:glycosyltransferase [Paenibacillus sabuli]MBD2847130.1 glycosyltransferase family 2 protein [Paenibacillus sabuli]